jgi:hypothetical protein
VNEHYDGVQELPSREPGGHRLGLTPNVEFEWTQDGLEVELRPGWLSIRRIADDGEAKDLSTRQVTPETVEAVRQRQLARARGEYVQPSSDLEYDASEKFMRHYEDTYDNDDGDAWC